MPSWTTGVSCHGPCVSYPAEDGVEVKATKEAVEAKLVNFRRVFSVYLGVMEPS